MKTSAAEILREYGPFPGAEQVHGVTFDGRHVWFASGDKLNAFDLQSGKTVRSIDVAAHAGRSEEHTSELQSLMRISYAVFCLKKKNKIKIKTNTYEPHANTKSHTIIYTK